MPTSSWCRTHAAGEVRSLLRAFRRFPLKRVDWYVEGIEFGSCNWIAGLAGYALAEKVLPAASVSRGRPE